MRAADREPEAWIASALTRLEPYRGEPLSSLIARLHPADETVPQPERTLHIWRGRVSVATDEQTGGAVPGQGYRTVGRIAHCTLVVEAGPDEAIMRFGLTREEPACNRIMHWLR